MPSLMTSMNLPGSFLWVQRPSIRRSAGLTGSGGGARTVDDVVEVAIRRVVVGTVVVTRGVVVVTRGVVVVTRGVVVLVYVVAVPVAVALVRVVVVLVAVRVAVTDGLGVVVVPVSEVVGGGVVVVVAVVAVDLAVVVLVAVEVMDLVVAVAVGVVVGGSVVVVGARVDVVGGHGIGQSAWMPVCNAAWTSSKVDGRSCQPSRLWPRVSRRIAARTAAWQGSPSAAVWQGAMRGWAAK
mmetsp:Transcript_92417/g.261355  ORF Transcript_92417/g.261355 Transcript_92417/m.261355 type:complete len:238 (-) Transcript_92417:826-1539(-)